MAEGKKRGSVPAPYKEKGEGLVREKKKNRRGKGRARPCPAFHRENSYAFSLNLKLEKKGEGIPGKKGRRNGLGAPLIYLSCISFLKQGMPSMGRKKKGGESKKGEASIFLCACSEREGGREGGDSSGTKGERK